MDALRHDILYALRVLRQDRTSAVAVILTLAVCLGANTAIFTVVRSVLLRPLPYPEPDRLVSSYDSFPGGWGRSGRHLGSELRGQTRDDGRVRIRRALSVARLQVGEGSRAEGVSAMTVTPSFFQVLGASAARGRLFTEEEGTPGRNKGLCSATRLPPDSRAVSTASSDVNSAERRGPRRRWRSAGILLLPESRCAPLRAARLHA